MKLPIACVALSLAVVLGCSKSTTDEATSDLAEIPADAPLYQAVITLCGGCGQVKGTEACCTDGAEVCKCGLHKGSPGCCKIDKGADVTLCSACGQAEDSEACCAEGAEVCLCGMHKGAPGCCLDKAVAAKVAAAEAVTESAEALSKSLEGLDSADPEALLDAAESSLEATKEAADSATNALERAIQEEAAEAEAAQTE